MSPGNVRIARRKSLECKMARCKSALDSCIGRPPGCVRAENGKGRIAAEQQDFFLQMLGPLEELYMAGIGRQQAVGSLEPII